MENRPDNVLIIFVHVNRIITAFRNSGKPAWAAGNTVKLADRYAQAWLSNRERLERDEKEFYKIRDMQ